MFSPSQHEDKKFLLELADLIETLVRLKEYNLAERFGKHYLDLQDKIKTHDYTKDDKCYESLCRN
jgi:hypothetical protein